MKITKARLKQIIKEELDGVVVENREEFVKYAPDGTRLGTDDIGAHISDSLRRYRENPRRGPAEDHIDRLVKQLVDFFGDDPDDARDRVNAEFRKMMTGTIREYSPYQKGARPDKPHKKPGETKDDGKYADPKRARPKRMNEELTRQDKTDVKKMVKDELGKLLKKKDTKDEMGEIVKKIMKKLYKDLSLEHPYIIDRIKI